jgi:hypothetical protein
MWLQRAERKRCAAVPPPAQCRRSLLQIAHAHARTHTGRGEARGRAVQSLQDFGTEYETTIGGVAFVRREKVGGQTIYIVNSTVNYRRYLVLTAQLPPPPHANARFGAPPTPGPCVHSKPEPHFGTRHPFTHTGSTSELLFGCNISRAPRVATSQLSPPPPQQQQQQQQPKECRPPLHPITTFFFLRKASQWSSRRPPSSLSSAPSTALSLSPQPP